jgi:hypothetical protein
MKTVFFKILCIVTISVASVIVAKSQDKQSQSLS